MSEKVARKLIETVSLPYDLEGLTISVTTSAGVALYPALCAAQDAGKNAYRVAQVPP